MREELGEGYSPFARHVPTEAYDDFGYAYARNIADPGNATEIAAMMKEIGNQLGTGNVTEDELQRVLEPTRQFLQQYLRRNAYWLERVLARSQRDPETLEWARTIESDYAAITRDELNDLARTYFGNGRSVEVIITPEPMPDTAEPDQAAPDTEEPDSAEPETAATSDAERSDANP